jgi:hypothetical protein
MPSNTQLYYANHNSDGPGETQIPQADVFSGGFSYVIVITSSGDATPTPISDNANDTFVLIGSHTGPLNWTFAIQTASGSDSSFTLSASAGDATSLLQPGFFFNVSGSTAGVNDRAWEVLSSSFDPATGQTTIVVPSSPAVSSDTTGTVTLSNMMGYCYVYTVTLSLPLPADTHGGNTATYFQIGADDGIYRMACAMEYVNLSTQMPNTVLFQDTYLGGQFSASHRIVQITPGSPSVITLNPADGDCTLRMGAGAYFAITGSPSDNGDYRISSASFNGTSTIVETESTLAAATTGTLTIYYPIVSVTPGGGYVATVALDPSVGDVTAYLESGTGFQIAGSTGGSNDGSYGVASSA